MIFKHLQGCLLSTTQLFALILHISILAAIFIGYDSAQAKTPQDQGFQDVVYVKNFDGDSITFDIPDTPNIVGKDIVVRLRGIDTPELSKSSCQLEKEKAIAAREMVHTLLKEAMCINLHNIGRGKYFRIVADIEFDGKDLATILLKNKLAVPYSGKKKSHNWCTSDTFRKTPAQNATRSILPPKIDGVYIWPPPPQ